MSTTPDPDQAVLSELEATGADLSKPTHILFYVYVPSEEAATRIAAAAADSALEAEVRPAAFGGGWLCLLQGQIVLSLEILKMHRSRFEDLALAEGGEYDGWEAAAVMVNRQTTVEKSNFRFHRGGF